MNLGDNLEKIAKKLGRKYAWHDDMFDAIMDNQESQVQYIEKCVRQIQLVAMNLKGVSMNE